MTHLSTTRRPMSEARRNHIHGPLIGLSDEPASRFEHGIWRAIFIAITAGVIGFSIFG